MPLILTITSSQKDGLGDTSSHEFGIHGGTVGRSVENDWVLPDAKRYVSSRHFAIDFRAGSYYLVDTSTNGIYVNDAEVPVGRGKPQRLFSGDQLRAGEYQMTVQIEGDQTMELLAHDNLRRPVDKAQQVSAPEPTRDDLINVSDITGAVEIQQLLAEDAEEDAIRLAAERAAASLSLEETRERQKPALNSNSPDHPIGPQRRAKAVPPAAPKTPQAAPTPPAPQALEHFFHGAGLANRKLDARQTQLLMQRLGQLMREMVMGLTETLHVRSEQKNTLRVAHTTIQKNNNNPLKFSAGVDEALDNLLTKTGSAYTAPVEAVREAFDDIKTHQAALLAGMQQAFQDYVDRLDPEELQQRFDSGLKRSALLGAANKMKYWDLYGELYQVMTQHSPGMLPRLFSDELARAYEQQLEQLSKDPKQATDKKAPAA